MFEHSVPERKEKLVQKPGLLTAKLILDWGGTDAIIRKSKEAQKGLLGSVQKDPEQGSFMGQ